MATLMSIEVNCTTGEVTERELTAEEIADNQRVAAEIDAKDAARAAEIETRSAHKASAFAKLAALGLTEDEIAAL